MHAKIRDIVFLTLFFVINSICLTIDARAGNSRSKQMQSAIPGVSVTCNILDDNSLQVQGTNTTAKSYDCDVTCNLSNNESPAIFNCTPTFPPTPRTVICATRMGRSILLRAENIVVNDWPREAQLLSSELRDPSSTLM